MRARWVVPLIVVLVGGAGVWALTRGGDPVAPTTTDAREPGEPVAESGVLASRAVTSGSVEIAIEPIRIDDTGAVFLVAMNTHSGELSADLARTARLEVDGIEWAGAAWTGDPPGGHHREGELSFEAAGPARGSAVLTIRGFADPIQASWTLGGS